MLSCLEQAESVYSSALRSRNAAEISSEQISPACQSRFHPSAARISHYHSAVKLRPAGSMKSGGETLRMKSSISARCRVHGHRSRNAAEISSEQISPACQSRFHPSAARISHYHSAVKLRPAGSMKSGSEISVSARCRWNMSPNPLTLPSPRASARFAQVQPWLGRGAGVGCLASAGSRCHHGED